MQTGDRPFSDFGKWWDDPKKHFKRMNHWLPHLRSIAVKLKGSRGIRYFSLCARHMIDVFMLVDEKLLNIDNSHEIQGVQFCEMYDASYTEIRQIVARENSGFLGRLEDVALFIDSPYTARFASLEDIQTERQQKGESLSLDEVESLQLKETSLLFGQSFPYDYINLDFCGYYYDDPPNVFRITDTVDRFLDWQRNSSRGADPVSVDEFVLAVTCKYGDDFPKDARDFLEDLIRQNCNESVGYADEVRRSRGDAADLWMKSDPEDTFLTAWPKHIVRKAAVLGWEGEILDFVYYHRPADSSGPYIMICLVLQFKRASAPSYLPAALYALDKKNRKLIPDFSWTSSRGKVVRRHLERVRSLRNAQARLRGAVELPEIGSA